MPIRPDAVRHERAACLLVGVLCGVVYGRTLLPGVGFWDIGEFQTVPHVLGIAHPTGYPLYTLIGKLWTLWPFGTIAYRMNVLSAVSASLAAVLLAALAMRMGVRAGLAIAAALAFACSEHVWRTALHADPHTLHAVIVAALWFCAWRWWEAVDVRWLWGLGLGAGLGLGNHMLLLFELPALALALLLPGARRLDAPAIATSCGLGALGLLVYAYMPLRAMADPPLNYANPTTWERFRYLVTGEQFQNGMGFLSLGGLQAFARRLPELVQWHAHWLTGPGLVMIGGLALVGTLSLAGRARPMAAALWVGIGLPFYVAGTYVNADLGRYFIVPTLLAMLLASLGAEWLLGRTTPGFRRAVLAVLLLLVAGLAVRNGPGVDAHRDVAAERYERSLLAMVRPQAVILSWWSYSTPLWYGRYVEGLRPDVTIVDESLVVQRGWGDMVEAIARFGHRPVYIVPPDGLLPKLFATYRLHRLPVGDTYGQGVYEVVGRYQPLSRNQ